MKASPEEPAEVSFEIVFFSNGSWPVRRLVGCAASDIAEESLMVVPLYDYRRGLPPHRSFERRMRGGVMAGRDVWQTRDNAKRQR